MVLLPRSLEEKMAAKKKSEPLKTGAKYMVYAALVGLIVIVAFVIGTAVGFYSGTNMYSPSGETCEPIDCPDQYQCKPGEICEFNKCEVCTVRTRLKVS
jgi:hypothetical protein